MTRPAPLTNKQRALARHALGLPNRRRRSYRNYFTANYAPGGYYDEWVRMTEEGWAHQSLVIRNGLARFWLTPAGAAAALDPGESLDPEDFPS